MQSGTLMENTEYGPGECSESPEHFGVGDTNSYERFEISNFPIFSNNFCEIFSWKFEMYPYMMYHRCSEPIDLGCLAF